MATAWIIDMEKTSYTAVNLTLSIFILSVDLFFLFCIFFPGQGRGGLKQPLKTLLGSVVWCSSFLQIFFIVHVCLGVFSPLSDLSISVCIIIAFAEDTSLISSLLLNVYYFIQIVPSRIPLFVWMKRNINLLTYWSLLSYGLYLLLDVIVSLINTDILCYRMPPTNSTVGNWTTPSLSNQKVRLVILLGFRVALLCLTLGVMSASSCATVRYLCLHIKNMGASSLLSPQLQSQMRVTLTGISQALLYVLCSLWSMMNICLELSLSVISDPESHILLTVFSVYSLGTAINLGVGQMVFRLRIIELCQAIKNCFQKQ